MRIVMMGPPGVGKGTQAARLAAELGVPAISTGDLFRSHVADETPLGRELREVLEGGGYVPDEITNALVAERLAEEDAGPGFILDGYPRTPAQVDELARMTGDGGIHCAILLTAGIEVVMQRLHGRALEQNRTDDTPEVIRRRIEVYERETAPLAQIYDDAGVLARVDGTADQDEVARRVRAAVGRP